jgi:hypothetical protein
VEFVHGRSDRDDFLHHFAANKRRDETRAGASEEDTITPGGEIVLFLEHGQELQDLFGLTCIVAFVCLGEYFASRRRQDVFACRAADVEATHETFAREDRGHGGVEKRAGIAFDRLNLD